MMIKQYFAIHGCYQTIFLGALVTDEEFLMRFLKARKMIVEDAFELYEAYYRFMSSNPEIFHNNTINNPQVSHRNRLEYNVIGANFLSPTVYIVKDLHAITTIG